MKDFQQTLRPSTVFIPRQCTVLTLLLSRLSFNSRGNLYQFHPPQYCLQPLPIANVLSLLPSDLRLHFQDKSTEFSALTPSRNYRSNPTCSTFSGSLSDHWSRSPTQVVRHAYTPPARIDPTNLKITENVSDFDDQGPCISNRLADLSGLLYYHRTRGHTSSYDLPMPNAVLLLVCGTVECINGISDVC
ncbi:uncharacterized protein BJ212DRAFT_52658 [Suillus subaureus]|uniref:Uncharacterized protein n=1 Tax=Suillus subaureus TaxID=48587 RepID=A0A9P7JKK9_9AGAM|nr:uncharacterized protein BJ212DRAFT_52658 [Suillus subaureus]KAG1827427.1 hypothetical protein BJ212DRAFT_52658 [Suillus subaureus]